MVYGLHVSIIACQLSTVPLLGVHVLHFECSFHNLEKAKARDRKIEAYTFESNAREITIDNNVIQL